MTQPAPKDNTKARTLIRLIAGQVCLHGSMAGMRLAAPLLALKEGHSALAVGVLLALFSLSQVFLALPAGRYADRHGLRRPIGWGVIAGTVGAVLPALMPHFVVLCATALLMGAATGITSIALQRHVGRLATGTAELKSLFSWLALGPAISNFLGPVMAGLLIDHAGVWMGGAVADARGFQIAFVGLAMLPVLTWFLVRHTAELPNPQPAANAVQPAVRSLLHNPTMRRLLVVNWLLSSCWDVHTFVVPVLGHERGFSASVIGSILGGFAVAAALVRVAIPLLASQLQEWKVVTTSMLVTATVFAIYPFMPTPLTMGVCSVLLGLALGAVQPMILSTLHQITPHAQHGQALALRLMITNMSSVLMPMLFGTAGVAAGVSMVFWTMGSLVAAGSRAAWRLRP
jgi:MFS family permease